MATLLLTSSGQEWQFHGQHCYWHLVVKNGNFTFTTDTVVILLLTGLVVGNDNFTLLLTSSGQEWQFHCYWHLVVKNGNFTFLLTSSGQEWQFHIATVKWSRISHCYWHLVVNGNFTLLNLSHFTFLLLTSRSRMAISHCYWHLVVKNGNFTLLLTSSSQEWQFHIVYWHLVVKNGNFTFLLTSSVKNGNFTLLLDI